MNVVDEQHMRAKILRYPDERLLKPSVPVDSLDETTTNVALLLERMVLDLQTLGLSAPQINVQKRLFVLKRNGRIYHLINPELSWTNGRQTFYEGCSSFPGQIFKVERHAEVVIDAVDLHGKEISFLLDDELGRVAQHQIDHLNGILVNAKGELLSQDAA